MNRYTKIVVLVLAAALLGAGSLPATSSAEQAANPSWRYGRGYGMPGPGMSRNPGGYGGMMGGRGGFGGMMSPGGAWQQVQPLDNPLTLDTATERVTKALTAWGYADLEIEEVVQYSLNFYALVRERSTGKGALELLVDPLTGTVSLEPGPGMMWNTRYGRMHWAGPPASAVVSADEAIRIAREWLAARGDTISWEYELTEMPGYFSIHLEKDGRMEAMLGVNARSGAVWYHTWHGAYVAAKEMEH